MKKYIHMILTVFFVGLMTLPSFASEMYLYDESGLLAADELFSLNTKAASISEEYGFGIYAIILNDYQKFNTGNVYTTAAELYHALDLGKGENREGVLLMLSMEDRDYATFFYGENVEYAFDEYGQILLEDQFLDDFSDNNWYDGFADYLDTCDEFFELAANGKPVRESHGLTYIAIIAVSMIIAFIVTKGMESNMKNVRIGGSTISYAAEGGLQVTERGDHFLYTTQSRRRIESSTRSGSGSRSGSHSGGGGSGRSGKF